MPKKVTVFTSSKLSPTEYVPGVSPDGTELPEEEAERLLEAGLVVRNKPKQSEPPAEKSEDSEE